MTRRSVFPEQTSAIMRGILGHLSEEHRVQGEAVGVGSLLERITFKDSPVVVGLHEAERHETYAITIFDDESGVLVVNWVLLLGYFTDPIAHWAFCPVRQQIIGGHRRCEACRKAEFSWPESDPKERDYVDAVVTLVVDMVKFALTLR